MEKEEKRSLRKKDKGLIPIEDYAREKSTSPERVVLEIRDGQLSGRKIEESWFVDLPPPENLDIRSSTSSRAFDKKLLIPPALFLILVATNVPLLAMPGALLFLLGDAVATFVFGSSLFAEFHGDHLWPIAFRMGFVWPIGAMAIFLGFVVHNRKSWSVRKWIVFLALLIVWDIGLSIVLRLSAMQ